MSDILSEIIPLIDFFNEGMLIAKKDKRYQVINFFNDHITIIGETGVEVGFDFATLLKNFARKYSN
ncbi:MAG: hypothetical protein RR348_01690 [Clostridia bacterium]